MLLRLKDDAVPDLESLTGSFKVLPKSERVFHRKQRAHLLLKPIKLYDSDVLTEDFELMAFGRPAPLRSSYIAAVQCESIPTTRRLPPQSTLC